MSGHPILKALTVAVSVAALVGALAGPTSAADASVCKKGGWKTLVTAGGDAFKNQGACIRYVKGGGVPVTPPTGPQPIPLDGILAVAYSDIDSLGGYSTGDVLIARLVDNNGDGVPSVGDTIEMGRYPTNLGASAFGGWNVTSHGVVSVTAVTANLVIVTGISGSFTWLRNATYEAYNETDGSNLSALQDGLTSPVNDVIQIRVGSPSSPDTAVAAAVNRPTDDAFIDVGLNYTLPT